MTFLSIERPPTEARCVRVAPREIRRSSSAVATRPLSLHRRCQPGGQPSAHEYVLRNHVARWPSGWNVDRQKRDCEDRDRIKRNFRDVETSTPPLLYSLLVHGRPPLVVNASISAPSACRRTASRKCSESLPGPPVAPRWRNGGPPPEVTFRELL